MRRLLCSWGLAAALLGPALASAHPAQPLTLDQALDLAESRSFGLSAARREVEAAGGAISQAGARPNPRLNASVEDTQRATRSTTATVDYPLELGGKRGARIDAAERGRDVAQAELGQAQAGLQASVIAAYFATLVAQERSKLAKDSADLATRGADAVAKRVAAGKVSPVDETRARVDQANALLEATEASAELQTARQALASLWGDAEPTFSQVTGDITQAPGRATAAELLQRLEASPALLASRLEVSRRRSLVEVEKSKAVPDVTVSVGARRDNELGRTQAIVGVSMPLPFFDRNQGAVVEADRRAQKAADEYQATRIRVVTELQQATNQLAVARTSVVALQTTVLPAAQQAYDAATTGFEAGKFGFLDVIDARRTLLQARARYLTTLSSAYQAATAIDRLIGR